MKLLTLGLAGLFMVVPAWSQDLRPGLQWRDGKGVVRSRGELETILQDHQLWLKGKGPGSKGDLRERTRPQPDPCAPDWRVSNNEGGFYTDLKSADLTQIGLSYRELSLAYMDDVHLEGAYLAGVRLCEAYLSSAHLAGANLIEADLRRAILADSDLSRSRLPQANLEKAALLGADLGGTFMFQARLAGAYFEPKVLPPTESIAEALDLDLMTYDTNPRPLADLRKQFQDAGYREQERQITYALNRRQADLDSPGERWFKRVAFDWTCQYGLSYGRPLKIVAYLWLLCSFLYAGFMHHRGPSGIYLIGTRTWRGRSISQGLLIRPRRVHASALWKVPFLWLGSEWRVLRAAMFFSLMAAFNIGFRDINFGRWLRLLTNREYDLKAIGWARTLAGFQSLLSVYLVALWVLTYFGRPFG